jgi:phosphoribosyl 1,2-cyclic phosphodiesterase
VAERIRSSSGDDWEVVVAKLYERGDAANGSEESVVVHREQRSEIELADRAALLVIEATFLSEDSDLATRYGRLTAQQAARAAAECGVRRLVLTHFSQRYNVRHR